MAKSGLREEMAGLLRELRVSGERRPTLEKGGGGAGDEIRPS